MQAVSVPEYHWASISCSTEELTKLEEAAPQVVSMVCCNVENMLIEEKNRVTER